MTLGYKYVGPNITTLASGHEAAQALADDASWVYDDYNVDAADMALQSTYLENTALACAGRLTRLTLELLTLYDNLRQLAVAGGTENIPKDDSATSGLPVWAPEATDLILTEIPPFTPRNPATARTQKEVKAARQLPKWDHVSNFAPNTDSLVAFGPTVHQSNTFVPTVPITPLFKESADGETDEYRE